MRDVHCNTIGWQCTVHCSVLQLDTSSMLKQAWTDGQCIVTFMRFCAMASCMTSTLQYMLSRLVLPWILILMALLQEALEAGLQHKYKANTQPVESHMIMRQRRVFDNLLV